MAPGKPFPSVSRIIDEKFEQRAMEMHKRNLESVKPIVDTSQPQYMHHLDRNAKKAEQEAERQYEIEAENARLYQRLANIEDFDSTAVLRASSVRSSLTAKPGMYYSHGQQCVDHINLTAMSNPRSLHYRGPSVSSSQVRSLSRGPSRRHIDLDNSGIDGSENGEEAGGNHGEQVFRRTSRSSVDTDTLIAPRSASVSLSGTFGGRPRVPHPPSAPHPHGVGSAYLAPPVAPNLPPKAPGMGPHQWSVQLARPHRVTGEGSEAPPGIGSLRNSASGMHRLSAEEYSGHAPGAVGSSEDGAHQHKAEEDRMSLPRIPRSRRESRADGEPEVSASADAPHFAGSASARNAPLARSADAAARAMGSPARPPRPSFINRGGALDQLGGGSVTGSPYGTPQKAPSRGASPMRGRGYGTPSRGASPATSRGASPMRFRGDSVGVSGEYDASAVPFAFAPDHGLRKEILKSTYLGGASVQAKGNSIMASRRSYNDLASFGSGGGSVHGSLATRSSLRYSGAGGNDNCDDDDMI